MIKRLSRLLLHIPVGMLNAFLMLRCSPLGWGFLVFFAIYELNEDMHIKDQAWLDIAGWLWGYAIFALGGLLL